MRLLDQVAQDRSAVFFTPIAGTPCEIPVTAARDFAADVVACPLRYVLNDDLTRVSAELAFSSGDRLAGCLDLVRIPAPLLWIEWNDAVHKQVIHESGSAAEPDREAAGRKVGVLLRATTCGQYAIARTFCSNPGGPSVRPVSLAPIETHFNLSGEGVPGADAPATLSGAFAKVSDSRDAGVSALLERVRYRFDDQWASYYQTVAITREQQETVVNGSIAAVVRDAPFLLAFLLLLSAPDATRSLMVARDIINRKRQNSGRAPLLDHIEVRSTINSMRSTSISKGSGAGRRQTRLHHVRGHIVRRDNRVFWRTPHLRGHASAGIVRSRTVCLSFERRQNAAPRADGSGSQTSL